LSFIKAKKHLKQQAAHLNNQGLLITVLALVLVVSYSPEEYDLFDLFIGLVGLLFAGRYLVYGRSKHSRFSDALIGSLAIASLGIIIFYLCSLCTSAAGDTIVYNCDLLNEGREAECKRRNSSDNEDVLVAWVMLTVGCLCYTFKQFCDCARKILLKRCSRLLQ